MLLLCLRWRHKIVTNTDICGVFALASPLWKQSRSKENFNAMCRMVLIYIHLLFTRNGSNKKRNTKKENQKKIAVDYFFSHLRSKMTDFPNEIKLI